MPSQHPGRPRPPRRRDRGSAAVELVLITPLLMLILLITVALARMVSTHMDTADAAQQAARAASLTRSPGAARRAATSAADSALAAAHQSCTNLHVTASTGDFRPGGSVTVAVSCTTRLSDLGVPLPGAHTSTATARSPIDLHRALYEGNS